MTQVVVVATANVVLGREEEARAALRALCEATHANDEGCLLYALHTVPDDPSRLVMIEKWESVEALHAHGSADHVRGMAAVDAFAGPPEVTILAALDYGDSVKGSL